MWSTDTGFLLSSISHRSAGPYASRNLQRSTAILANWPPRALPCCCAMRKKKENPVGLSFLSGFLSRFLSPGVTKYGFLLPRYLLPVALPVALPAAGRASCRASCRC